MKVGLLSLASRMDSVTVVVLVWTSLVHHLPSANGEGKGYQDREGVGGTMKGKGIP